MYPNIIIIIPSFDPDEKLLNTINGLKSAGFSDIVLVDDGSAEESLDVFEKASALQGVMLLRHKVNRGKGAALKTAFRYIKENRLDSIGAVTVDGDGQHLAHDVAACADAMAETGFCVLGCRDFDAPGIPERSKAGNRTTQKVFKRFFGIDVSDTQTGLRAIPANYYSAMLEIDGERYEYENNMLVAFRDKNIPFTEIGIDTVYIDDNSDSHFRPVRDSARIYYRLFERPIKYTASSLSCALVENVLQTVLHDFLTGGITSRLLLELCDFLPARLISSLLNYYFNRKFVFKKERSAGSLGRYFALWAVQAVVTWLCVTGVESITGGTDGALYFVVITLIKAVIFVLSYKIQKKWVFKENK